MNMNMNMNIDRTVTSIGNGNGTGIGIGIVKEKDHHTRKASQMLGEAKKRITESKAVRRREELKAQIKFVGPLNPLSFQEKNQWI